MLLSPSLSNAGENLIKSRKNISEQEKALWKIRRKYRAWDLSSWFRLSHMSNVITYDIWIFTFVCLCMDNFLPQLVCLCRTIYYLQLFQLLLTIWMHISCFYDMSYVITFDIWEVRIMRFNEQVSSSLFNFKEVVIHCFIHFYNFLIYSYTQYVYTRCGKGHCNHFLKNYA